MCVHLKFCPRILFYSSLVYLNHNFGILHVYIYIKSFLHVFNEYSLKPSNIAAPKQQESIATVTNAPSTSANLGQQLLDSIKLILSSDETKTPMQPEPTTSPSTDAMFVMNNLI